MTVDPAEFPTPIRDLLARGRSGPRIMPVVPSGPADGAQLSRLRRLSTDDLFPKATVRDRNFARCVRAGLFLYFSALDESHTISQSIGTASGSYWHGIMHRQEGDWGNAKYWFRRVGTHPVLRELDEEAASGWDPFEFVDRCARAARSGAASREVQDGQMREWLLLMRHCHHGALAG